MMMRRSVRKRSKIPSWAEVRFQRFWEVIGGSEKFDSIVGFMFLLSLRLKSSIAYIQYKPKIIPQSGSYSKKWM